MSMYLESCWSWILRFNFCICLFLIWQEQIRSQDMRRFSKDKSTQLPFLLQYHHQSRLSSLSSSSLGVITNREENWSFLKIHGNKFQHLWSVDRANCRLWLMRSFHHRRCRYHCHLYRPHHYDHCNIDCYHHHQEIALTALITCIRRRTQEAILAASNCPD